MEALQTWLPSRISSNIDLITNALGALLGGAVVAPFTSALIDRGTLTQLRTAWFEPHASFAIILLLLWPFAQIFPQEHLFGMGGIVREWLTDPDSWPMQVLQMLVPDLPAWQESIGLRPDDMQSQQLLETLVTASSWIGTGLFASISMRRHAPMLRILAGLLATALLLKAMVAELQFPDGTLQLAVRRRPLRTADQFSGAGLAAVRAALATRGAGHGGADHAGRADQRAAVESVCVDLGARLAHGAVCAFQQHGAVARVAVAVPGVLLCDVAV